MNQVCKGSQILKFSSLGYIWNLKDFKNLLFNRSNIKFEIQTNPLSTLSYGH